MSLTLVLHKCVAPRFMTTCPTSPQGSGALEEGHGHVGGDGGPQGEGRDGLGGEVGHVEGFGALEGTHGHVGGDGGPQGGDGLGGEVGNVVKNLGATFIHSLEPRIYVVSTLVTRNAIEH